MSVKTAAMWKATFMHPLLTFSAFNPVNGINIIFHLCSMLITKQANFIITVFSSWLLSLLSSYSLFSSSKVDTPSSSCALS